MFFSLSQSSSSAIAPVGVAGSMARFALVNDYLYTVTISAINSFNISQPQNPLFTGVVNMGWGIETIYPFQNNLFIGSTTGMFIYGTTNPAKPNYIARFSHATACDPVVADNDYAYVTLRTGNACSGQNNQMDLINIQNLSSPRLVKSYPLSNPHGLCKDGNVLFICDGTSGLKVYNATNVSDLQLVKTIDGINAFDVIAYNNLALVVGKDGLYQYDYTNLSNIRLLSKLTY